MADFTTGHAVSQTGFMGTMRRMVWVVGMLAAGTLWGAERPAVCTGSGHAALSFWVGDWRVSDPSGTELGSSKIEFSLDGCEVTETWSSGANFRGSNVHAYSAEDQRWRQLNVDNHGHVHVFEGTAGAHGLDYTGVSKNEAGRDVLNRMDIVNEGANRVKVWRKSANSGKTWTTAYEAIYSRTDNTK